MRVAELSREERPREKLLTRGPESLSTAELVAVLLRTGTREEGVLEFAQGWLGEIGGLAGLLRLAPSEILGKKGIGKAKAAALLAALELSRRLAGEQLRVASVLDSPEAVFQFLAPRHAGARLERFGVLTLNVRHRLIAEHVVHEGTRDGAQVEPGEVFRRAILDNAHAVILWHNHPSGDPTPSQDDLLLTRTLVEAGKVLRIAVLDHLVLGAEGFVSFRRQGVIP